MRKGVDMDNTYLEKINEENNALPLSFAQKRLWFISQLDPDNTSYNLVNAVKIKGTINAKLLEQSINDIVMKHETLRTVFRSSHGDPYRHIMSDINVSLHITDTDTVDAYTLIADEYRYVFDLSIGPLLRIHLLEINQDEYIFVFNMHHIISDAWSIRVFINELIDNYLAALQGKSPSIPVLDFTYSDYTEQQIANLNDGLYKEDIAYWSEKLRNISSLLPLQTDYPRPQIQKSNGNSIQYDLADKTAKDLFAFAKREKSTVFMVLLSCFNIVISRHTGEKDILLGTPISGRNNLKTEPLIGYLSNTLVLRNQINDKLSFRQFLRVVSDNVLDAYDHQDLPFEKLIEILNPERSLNASPLFQVFFSFQNKSKSNGMKNITIEPFRVKKYTSKFDICIEIEEHETGVSIEIEYSTCLFDIMTIEKLYTHFCQVIECITSCPDMIVSEIDILDTAEKNLLLNDWNNTQSIYPKDKCVHQLFEELAKKNGSKNAVIVGENKITYDELNRKANNLSFYLLQHGISAGDRIGIYMDTGLSAIVSILGIWKTGCCYIPLDPSYPSKRIKEIADDSMIRAVLIGEGLSVEDIPDKETIYYSAIGNETRYFNNDNLADEVSSDSLAYILYTSGSTGKPKGVMINHNSVVNFLTSMKHEPGIKEDDVLLSVTNITFDISVLELFLPLTVGSSVILLNRNERQNASKLVGVLETFKPSVMQATPATWKMLIASGWNGDKNRLKILCGGEVLDKRLAETLLEKGCEVWNMYGPTETTIWSTIYKVTGKEDNIPIGRPIANTYIYILDDIMKPTPIGVIGDIYIGGQGLAVGYNNMQEETQQKFTDNSFGKEGRIYCTGDKGKYDKNGLVYYIGRNDHQLKIRGYRIEANEIENKICSYEGIEDCIVIAYPDKTGENCLAAYVTLKQDSNNVKDDDIYNYLNEELPHYMVPSYLVFLDEFPLSAHGKISRNDFPNPTGKNNRSIDENPRNTDEIIMVTIWKNILQTDHISIHDNFFRMGGHSILAVKLINEIKEKFHTDIHLKDLFLRPVLSELCNYIKEQSHELLPDDTANFPSIEPNQTEKHTPFPLTDIQKAYWLGKNSSLGLGGVATHIYQEFELKELDIERLNMALQKLIKRHEMLRVIVLQDGQQRILKDVPDYKIQTVMLNIEDSDHIKSYINEVRSEMSHQVIPSDQWPLFEIRASVVGSQYTVLHISFDLLIADAWSFQILLNEIALLYEDPLKKLKELDISFRDYVLALCEIENTNTYKNSQEYWMKRLDNMPHGPKLPLLKEPDSISKPIFKRFSYVLDTEEWTKVKHQAGRFNITPNGLLLAAFSVVLSKWSTENHFTLNVTMFNRLPLHPQINEIVGDFTSLLFLEINKAGEKNFIETAKNIQETIWNDMDHRYFSGTRVMRELIKNGRLHSVIPIVFTSLLGFDNPDYFSSIFTNNDLNKEHYGISQTPQIWLDHQVSEVDGALKFNWDFVDEIFPSDMIKIMFETYCELIKYLSDEKFWRQSPPIEFLKERQEKALFIKNDVNYYQNETLHTLFVNSVKNNPKKTAVIAISKELTYDELNQISDSIAHLLDRKIKQEGSIVAVYMEKGWEQIAAVLGILKAGCAYLPIDSDLPNERALFLLSKCNVKIVLTQNNGKPMFNLPEDIEVFSVDDKLFNLNYERNVVYKKNHNDLAYVIFTSGSTGTPKGVMIDHKGAVNTILDINNRFSIRADDKVLALSSLSFDLSVYDIFGTLAAGGTIVVPDAKKIQDPEHWLSLMKQHKITVWNSVPALMNMLINHGMSDSKFSFFHLHTVLLSGDWIPLQLPHDIRKVNPNINIISLGGATEASIWSIVFPIGEINPAWKSIPYGKSLVNQSVYVLDENFDFCPMWVTGELYIGGIGVALGYLDDEEKTNGSFLLHPRTGERLYKTGDLGRYMADGNIEFLGRKDSQVKIQGFRIELGEIESAIKESPLVKEVVVSAIGETQNNKKLCAYIIPDYKYLEHRKNNENNDDIIQEASRRLDFKIKEHAIRNDLQNEVIEFDGSVIAIEHFISRRSYRKFIDTVISFDDFNEFISCLSQMDLEDISFPKYMYASSGGLYPIQTYLYIKDGCVSGIRHGIYYFNPKKKSLMFLSDAFIDETIHVPENQPIFRESAFSIFFIAKMDAIIPMYGKDRSEKYCLMETGAICQLLEMNAPKNNIGLCQIGILNFDSIEPFFMLDDDCIFLHSIVGGYINKEQQTQEGIISEWKLYQTDKKQSEHDNTKGLYIDQLRDHLIKILPHYMIPKSFQIIKELPLTSNGKVDRKALNTMNNIKGQTKKHTNGDWSNVPADIPNSVIHEALIKIWMNLFKNDDIGIYDNFFDLGGDSLLITQAHKKIEEALSIEIKIVDLFRYPTISSLSKHLENGYINNIKPSEKSRAEMRLSRRNDRRGHPDSTV